MKILLGQLATTSQDPGAYPTDMIATLRQAQRQRPSETKRQHIGTSHQVGADKEDALYCQHEMSVIARGPLGPPLSFCPKARARLCQVWSRYIQDSMRVSLPPTGGVGAVYVLQIQRCHLAVWWQSVVSAHRPPPFELSILFPKIYEENQKPAQPSQAQSDPSTIKGQHGGNTSHPNAGASLIPAQNEAQTSQLSKSARKKAAKRLGEAGTAPNGLCQEPSIPSGTAFPDVSSNSITTPHKQKQTQRNPATPAAHIAEPQRSEARAFAIETEVAPEPASPQASKKRKRELNASDMLEELLYKACEMEDAEVRKEMKAFVEKQLKKPKWAKRKSEDAAQDSDEDGDEDMRDLLLSSLGKESADVRKFARSFYEQRKLQK